MEWLIKIMSDDTGSWVVTILSVVVLVSVMGWLMTVQERREKRK